DADFEHVFLHDEVRARKLEELVGSPVTASPEEVRDFMFSQFVKTEASFVAFRREQFQKDLKATEEELRAAYEKQKASLKTPEKRKVRYAAFVIPDPADGKPLEEKVRTKMRQDLVNKAHNFRQELEKTNGNFEELAKKYGGTVGVTKEFFTADQTPPELED